LAEVEGLRWIRLLYLYPEPLNEALVDLLAHHPRVLPYVDMPLQHVAGPLLRRMRRGHDSRVVRRCVEHLREQVPNLVFRTAFIVGHPGETDEYFQQLCDFVRWAQFDHVGVFRYSDEEDTASHGQSGKVPGRKSAERAHRLMSIQRPTSRRNNRRLLGKTMDVLVEGTSPESDLVMVGRHAGQAPDVDGSVILSGGPVVPGEWVRVRVTQSLDYDLVGEIESPGQRLSAPKSESSLPQNEMCKTSLPTVD
jgi:ribosomal protein S12 methylthiotransferase